MKSNAELIQDFIEKLTSEFAISLIEKDKGMLPTFVFLTKDKRDNLQEHLSIIPEALMDRGRAGKEFYMQVLFPKFKEAIKEAGEEIVSIAFICEAWKSRDMYAADNEMLNENNSEEVIMFSIHYPGNKVDFIYPIMRLGGNFILGPKEVKQSSYSEETNVGRFSHLFD